MKRILPILLLLLMTVQVFSSMGYLIWFKANQQEIAALFCVNRNTPEMHCNGNCQLMKHMKEDASGKSLPAIQKQEIHDFLPAQIHANIPSTAATTWKQFMRIPSPLLSKGYLQGVFEPPVA